MTDNKPLDHTSTISVKKPDSNVTPRKTYVWAYHIEVLQSGQYIRYHRTVSEIAAHANCDILEDKHQPGRLKFKGKVIREWGQEL